MSSLDDLIYLTMVWFEGDITGLETHAERVVSRGSDPWVLFLTGDQALVQWTTCCPFLPFDDTLNGYRRIKASVLFQAVSGAVILDEDVLDMDGALHSFEIDKIANAISVHIKEGLPMVPTRDLLEWRRLTSKHLFQQRANGKGALFTLGRADVYDHEQGGAAAGWQSFTHRLLCTNGVPMGWSHFYALLVPYMTADRAARSPWRGMWDAISKARLACESGLNGPAETHAPALFDFLKRYQMLWLAQLKPQATSYDIQAAVNDLLTFSYGKTEARKNIEADYVIQALRCRMLKPGIELGGTAEATEFVDEFPLAQKVFLNRDIDTAAELNGHLKRLLNLLGEGSSDLLPALNALEHVLRKFEHKVFGENSDKARVSDITQKVTDEVKDAATASGGHITTVKGFTSGEEASNTQVLRTIMCDEAWVAQAARLEGLALAGGNHWRLQCLLDIFDWSANILPRHFMFNQFMWGKRKITGHTHPVFSILNDIKPQRDLFLSLYLLFGTDMGESEKVTRLKSFKLPAQFLTKFWDGNFGEINWWYDFVQPMEDAYSFVDQKPPVREGLFLTREHLPLLQAKLLLLERVLGLTDIKAVDNFSITNLFLEYAVLLKNAVMMGKNSSFALEYSTRTQGLFDIVMAAAGPYITRPLKSDDFTDKPKKSFIDETEIQIITRFEELKKAVDMFVNMDILTPGMNTKLELLQRQSLAELERKDGGSSARGKGDSSSTLSA